MLNPALGLAALSAGASAFLIPSGINLDSTVDAISSPDISRSQSIKLPCPDCVFSSKDDDKAVEAEEDGLFWVQGRARDIILNFTLSDDSRAVLMNDWQVYPVTLDSSSLPTVKDVAASVSLVDAQEHPEDATILEVTGASISVSENELVTGDDVNARGVNLVEVNYQVLTLAGQFVSVANAMVTLLENPDGSLMIMSVEGVQKDEGAFGDLPFPPPPHPPHPPHRPEEGPHKSCGPLPAALCRIKGMVESKLEGFKQGLPHKGGKGCGGRKGPKNFPGHTKPHPDDLKEPEHDKMDNSERPEHHGPPGHPHPHGEHGMHRGPHRHHGHHGFVHRFLRAFVSILVPVLAGIAMGMLVSVVGILTGRLIAFLWMRFRRGGQRGYASVALAEDEAEAGSDGLDKGVIELVEEEPLPKYESAPAYEEKEQK